MRSAGLCKSYSSAEGRFLKLRASANADTKQEAIGLALKKLAAKSQKAKHQGKKPVSLPKVEKTWRNGIIGYGAKVSREFVDIKSDSSRRKRWLRR
jgi:hypothetical protein